MIHDFLEYGHQTGRAGPVRILRREFGETVSCALVPLDEPVKGKLRPELVRRLPGLRPTQPPASEIGNRGFSEDAVPL